MPIDNQMLARHLRRIIRESTRLKLYTATRNGASFTEARGGGYSDVELVAADWTITTTDPPHAESRVQQFVFDGTATLSIAGAYLVESAGGGVLWWEPFEQGPFDMRRPGDLVPVRAVLNLRGRTAQQRG
jgi:hypothetical protein